MDEYVLLYKTRMAEFKASAEVNPCGRTGGWLGLEVERDVLRQWIEKMILCIQATSECCPFDKFLCGADVVAAHAALKQRAVDAINQVMDYLGGLHRVHLVPPDFLEEQCTAIMLEINTAKMRASIMQVMYERIRQKIEE